MIPYASDKRRPAKSIFFLLSFCYVKRRIKWDRGFNAFETTFFDTVASLLAMEKESRVVWACNGIKAGEKFGDLKRDKFMD